MNRRERRAATKGSKTAPNALAAGEPDALYEAGLGHAREGRLLDAQLCCQQVLSQDPNYAAAMNLMGLLSMQAENFDQAVEWMSRAIRLDPKPEHLVSLAVALRRQGRHEEALKTVDAAVQLKPNDADLWLHTGDVLTELARNEQALLAFQHARRINPDHQGAHHKIGALLNRLSRHEEALAYLDRSDELHSNHAPTLAARAWALYHLNRWEESLAEGRRAHRLDSANPDICNNIGLSLWRLGRSEEALVWFDCALEIRPDFVAALDNKIICFFHIRRFDEVFVIYDRMKAVGLTHALTRWNVAVVHLLTGNFEAGWPGYQARLDLPRATYPQIPLPMWLGGEEIDGKTILIGTDEGL